VVGYHGTKYISTGPNIPRCVVCLSPIGCLFDAAHNVPGEGRLGDGKIRKGIIQLHIIYHCSCRKTRSYWKADVLVFFLGKVGVGRRRFRSFFSGRLFSPTEVPRFMISISPALPPLAPHLLTYGDTCPLSRLVQERIGKFTR
jgi:hypothetical protein